MAEIDWNLIQDGTRGVSHSILHTGMVFSGHYGLVGTKFKTLIPCVS